MNKHEMKTAAQHRAEIVGYAKSIQKSVTAYTPPPSTRRYMSWYYQIRGGHTHVRVFMNGGKCGDLCFRNEEFKVVFSNSPNVIFVEEGKDYVAPSGAWPRDHQETY